MFDQLQDIFLISCGAILGANIRFIIYEKLNKIDLINDFRILLINTLASFFLGIFLSVLPRISYYDFSYQLLLFFSIGLLGSLSTFSTFVYDLYKILIKFKFVSAFRLFFISVSLGTIALALGFFLGHK
ncbi:fluoride efflux transporter FluC [Prochlorococcus marinus]|uniref:fluoride efflux transporter FluC n=1 Tax=Prochlorococcus marinus TaxID=1219 RepID=UPI0022B2C55F|nr:CrcB family protein [Prochlorococcus marinus]